MFPYDIYLYMQILMLFLTFIIYLVSTLSYSVRIVGVRTGRIAVAFAVFNIFALISRSAGSIQSPLLTKKIESNIINGSPDDLTNLFRLLLLASTIAAIVGALLIPTFIKIFTRGVESFSIHKSIPRLIMHSISKSGIEQFKKSITIPQSYNFEHMKNFKRIPRRIVLLNAAAFSMSTVGSLAALYAGARYPEFRTTCNSLSFIINMFSTLIMFIFVDPYVSIMTDDVIKGDCSHADFDRCIVFLVAGLIVGTMAAQLLLVPAAEIIRFVAEWVPS